MRAMVGLLCTLMLSGCGLAEYGRELRQYNATRQQMIERVRYLQEDARTTTDENRRAADIAEAQQLLSILIRQSPGAATGQDGTPVYDASQCIGAVVNGVCHGTIMQNGSQPRRCHGQMINGQCTGPMF